MMRKLKEDKQANVDMILTAVIAGVMFAIAIPIIYSVLGGVDYTSVDRVFNADVVGWDGSNGSTPAANASQSVLTNLNTFFTIGPIYLVVVAAVGIIAAVLLLRGR